MPADENGREYTAKRQVLQAGRASFASMLFPDTHPKQAKPPWLYWPFFQGYAFEQSAAPLQITTQQNRADRDRTGDGANCAMEYVFQFDDE